MPWSGKYRQPAAAAAERGTRVTTEARDSSFSSPPSVDHPSSVCDMHHPRRCWFIVSALVLGACTAASEHTEKQAGTPVPLQSASVAAVDSIRPAAHAEAEASSNGAIAPAATPTGIVAMRDPNATPVIRALYVNRFAAQSAHRMRWLLSVADSTEVNGLVIDMKDEFGLNFHSQNAGFRKNEGSGHGMVRDVRALLDTIHAHNVFAIARIVVFKDPTTAAANPSWTIKQPDGETWHDK